MAAASWKVEVVDGVQYRVPVHVRITRRLGKGAFGSVVGVEDAAGRCMALKKISQAFRDLRDGKNILREIKLMQMLKHCNLTTVLDLYPPEHPDFDDVYILMEVMDTDLHNVIRSSQPLTEHHHRDFTWQILAGLAYLHRANVVHRDIKPQNVLVNKNCDVKICDFNLARAVSTVHVDQHLGLTEYVVTRPYRAPEVVLHPSNYSAAIDIWSVGCILCELVGRHPLFFGRDHVDQLKKIFAVIGKPTRRSMDWLPMESAAHRFVQGLPETAKRPWASLYPSSSVELHEAMEALLTFAPALRIGSVDAMKLSIFSGYDEEALEAEPVDWSFDDCAPTKRSLQDSIYTECLKFHPWIAERDADALGERGVRLA